MAVFCHHVEQHKHLPCRLLLVACLRTCRRMCLRMPMRILEVQDAQVRVPRLACDTTRIHLSMVPSNSHPTASHSPRAPLATHTSSGFSPSISLFLFPFVCKKNSFLLLPYLSSLPSNSLAKKTLSLSPAYQNATSLFGLVQAAAGQETAVFLATGFSLPKCRSC